MSADSVDIDQALPSNVTAPGRSRDGGTGDAPSGRSSDVAAARTTPWRTTQRRRRKQRTRLLAFAAIIGLAAGGGWWLWGREPAGKPGAKPTSATVMRRDFTTSVLATGAVQPQVGAEVQVGARISGKVVRLVSNIGDHVTKGQIVAELEKTDLESMVAQRQAELELARAKMAAVDSLLPKEIEKARLDLDESQATYTLAEKNLGRARQLVRRNVTTEDELDQAEERHGVSMSRVASARKALELAETRLAEELRQAKAEVARAQAALENVQVQLSYATITAPIDGVIASVSTEEGETVAAGMQAPTFVTVIDLQRLQIDAYVDEVDIGKVRVGQRVVFTVDAFPATDFEGKVLAIYPKAVIQDNVVNYDVVVDIQTPYHGLLRPEMTASVTIFLEKREGVLAVPVQAVQRERGKNVAYVLADGLAEPREIKVGWRDGQWIEVASGLHEGDRVLLEAPGQNLNNDRELP